MFGGSSVLFVRSSSVGKRATFPWSSRKEAAAGSVGEEPWTRNLRRRTGCLLLWLLCRRLCFSRACLLYFSRVFFRCYSFATTSLLLPRYLCSWSLRPLSPSQGVHSLWWRILSRNQLAFFGLLRDLHLFFSCLLYTSCCGRRRH